jgi:predicted phage terminase large subunit-like protein
MVATEEQTEETAIHPELQDQIVLQMQTTLYEKSLHDFVKAAWHIVEPGMEFRDNWHIKAICSHLEATARGEISQLLVNVPPGTSKSLICCVFFPAWIWTTQPMKRFLFFSYSENLSYRDSLKTRDIIRSAWYQARWNVQLKADRDTGQRFENTDGGWRLVGSIAGRGLGEHGDFTICDDPHNVLQAESDADRQKVTRWFEGVFCVRGEVRNTKRILIMQRLHSLDCSGIALEKGGWTHLCLPMKYETDHPLATMRNRPTKLGFYDPRTTHDELLWPQVYGLDKIANMEVNMGAYGAAGQLQQRPAPRGGGMFKRDWFPIKPAIPTLRKIVAYVDKAGTEGGTGAETAIVLIGEYEDGTATLESMRVKYIILECIHGRWEAAERESIIKQTAYIWESTYGFIEWWVEEEPGSGGKESAQSTIANMVGFSVKAEKVTGDKATRAEPLASQASVGKLSMKQAAWNRYALEEFEVFPVGKHKDIVDAASGGFNKLHQAMGGINSVNEIRTGRASIDDAQ